MELYIAFAVSVILFLAVILLIILLVRTKSGNKNDISGQLSDEFSRSRMENSQQLSTLRDAINEQSRLGYTERAESQKMIFDTLSEMMSKNADQNTKISAAVSDAIEKLSTQNEKKLEEMRLTVDEKLGSTLSQRLDGSFKRVSEQLEAVHSSLGEVKALSGGVTTNIATLNRVLTNVKSRGTWAEIRLEAILDETIPGQYVTNFSPDNSAKRVEFAIKIPCDGSFAYLPLDSKFPMEDYIRLTEAADAGDELVVSTARKALEASVIAEAKAVAKYINPPVTTPFAILYLATEGLYNEILSSKTGVAEKIRHDYNIIIAGPTTVIALLNSLALGFRSVKINEKAEEIEKTLVSVRAEYDKFADLLDKLEKKLSEAGNTLTEAKKKTENIKKSLDF